MEYTDLNRTCLTEYAEVFVEALNAPPWNDRWDISCTTARLKDIFDTPGFLGVAACDGQQCVGFAAGCTEKWQDSTVYYLREMCVVPARQQSGVGGRMLAALLDRLQAAGVTSIYLLTARGSLAENFYAKMGFAVSERMIMMKRQLVPDT